MVNEDSELEEESTRKDTEALHGPQPQSETRLTAPKGEIWRGQVWGGLDGGVRFHKEIEEIGL
jgi:hypothetical protein